MYYDLIKVYMNQTVTLKFIYPGYMALRQQEVEGGGGSTNKLSNQLTITSKHLKL